MDKSQLDTLLTPQAYPHPTEQIVLRETHISWVILTGDYAYKIKKPVNYGFLDFTTLKSRYDFCMKEIALNQRFTQNIYLDVVGITKHENGYRITKLNLLNDDNEQVPIIEYAIRMHQFDDSQQLDHLAERGLLTDSLCHQMARMLAHIHKALPPLYPDIDQVGSPQRLRAAVIEDFDLLFSFPHDTDERGELEDFQKRWMSLYSQAESEFTDRISGGFVHDCHGDTHLGNIVLIDNAPVLFDCIEFNDNFRIMDCMGEVGFLYMDIQSKGLSRKANLFLNDYLEYSGDYSGLRVFNLFRIHYALVRAKVNLVKCDAQDENYRESPDYHTYESYLNLTRGYFKKPEIPCYLAIMHGVSGSGKSTVARAVSAATNAIRLRSDVERKRLFGLEVEEVSDKTIYSEHASDMTFTRLQTLCEAVIDQGFSCIVDATFLHEHRRTPFLQLAQRLNVPFIIISCELDVQTMTERLIEREKNQQDASEATVEIMHQQLEHVEPLTQLELSETLIMNTRDGLPDNIKGLIKSEIEGRI